ncbi:phosphatase PAP2/dual specificity phosphatase family protein [Sphingomonas montana]|uniref:phosphatase PAP2/dual specificity phosphatase family protein n=1 Tax=Sphingomonas montana TaxID=1843236 RepID=UPI00096EDE9E|nr:phosphatase PAP2/dual specificity phosphatase family protein [Sphingomonas montana]
MSGAGTASEKPPTLRAFAALIGLGVVFYGSYGLANWLASLRSDVPSIVFGWERSVPFLAWTIIPYWTTNLFYAASLFLCRSAHELRVHGLRLVFVQLIAVACFVVFPLKFLWPKPPTFGVAGRLFDQLAGFDMPFNQAPSLHVALTVILASFYLPRLPRWLRAPFLGWSLMVVLSTMTTWQHHFVDLPTGALLGYLIVWALPAEGRSPLASMQLTVQPDRRRLGLRYAAGSAVSVLLATLGGGWLWFLWPAVSLMLVAAAYLLIGPAVFGKSNEGRIGAAARILLAPYLMGAWINSRLWTWRDPDPVEVVPDLWLSRFPARAQLKRAGRVVDLTAEISRPRWVEETDWRSFPCLDLVAPDPQVLQNAANAIGHVRPGEPVMVCCALGYGRSAATIATWMVINGKADDVQDSVAQLRRKRPRLAIRPSQLAAIQVASGRG